MSGDNSWLPGALEGHAHPVLHAARHGEDSLPKASLP